MPTFLPFRRPVKPHTESLAVCALIVSALGVPSCASRAAEPVALDFPARPAAVPPARPLAQPAPAVDARASDLGEATAEAGVSAGGLAPSPELGFETPYPFDARPRAPSSAQAAADDEELARWNLGGSSDPNYPSSQASFHPGTRVVVDARFAGRAVRKSSRASRALTADRVQAQVRSKGYWPFRLCFEARQREQKGLGGETRVRFTIGMRGKVSAARLISSELHNQATSACLLGELGKLRFAPAPMRAREVVVSIRIWPGDAELPPSGAPPQLAIDTSNGFDPTAMSARVATKRAELDACFGDARRADPSLWGRLALSVVLEVDGSVHRVSEVESHFPNTGAARCAAAALSALVFPSVNGKSFNFVQAIRLSPRAGTNPPDSNTNTEPTPPAPPDGAGGAAD